MHFILEDLEISQIKVGRLFEVNNNYNSLFFIIKALTQQIATTQKKAVLRSIIECY